MYTEFRETLGLRYALNNLLSQLADAKDSADVEDEWGKYMEEWSKGTGEEETEKKIEEYATGEKGPMDAGYTGSTIGIKLALLCIGYEAREQWYIDACD